MNSRLCVDIIEVPGHMYKDYLASVADSTGTTSSEFINAKPDFTKWESLFPNQNASQIESKFFNSDEFSLMPIVGISLKQAQDFCDWRTEQFKQELSKMSARERAQFPKEFKFRLPTAKEWARIRFLAQDKRILKQINKIASDTKSAFRLSKSKLLKKSEHIKHVYANQQEGLGFYNLLSNVAELTDKEGIAMGGSWFESNENEDFHATFKYNGPQAWLGFRCVFEIID